MYARTDVGGAYRWDSGEERWTPITDFIGGASWPLTGVESVAVDASDASRVYLALGIYNDARFGPSAIARSFDRGRTWTLCEMPFGMGGNEAGRGAGERLAVDPNCGERLLFGSRDRGLWQSSDAAASWRPVPSFPEIETVVPNPTPERWNYLTQRVGIVFVLFDPASGAPGARSQHVYAGVSTQATSLFESRDGGETWSPVPGQPTGLRPIRAALASDGTLYVSYGREPGPNTMFDGAVYRFRPATQAWKNITPIAPQPEHEQPFGYAGLSVDAQTPQRVLVATAYRDHAPGSGGDELFLTLDGGESWLAIGQRAKRDCSRAPWLAFGNDEVHVGHWIYALLIDPFDSNRAYYGTGQTIWGTHDLGSAERGEPSNFTVAALGIEETVLLTLASPPAGAEVWVGTGDISGFTVLDADHAQSHLALCGPTFKDTASIDFAERSPQLVVRVGSRGWNRARDVDTGAFSEDGGRSWRAFPSYPTASAQLGQIAVAANGQRWLWRPRGEAPHVSADLGRNWRACRGLPEAHGEKQDFFILSDRADEALFYVIEPRGSTLYRSDDGGEHFVPMKAPLPARGLSDGLAAFDGVGRLWLVLDGRLFHSVDGGASWRAFKVPAKLQLVALGRAERPGGTPTVFVAGQLASASVFLRSVDQGQNWTRLNDERQQFGQIRVIAGDPKRFGRLYIGTGGRGALYADPAHGKNTLSNR
jgi:photosystem II stability/assembly factor-like uncharacterized protein